MPTAVEHFPKAIIQFLELQKGVLVITLQNMNWFGQN